jgi:cytochrome c oxidase subunit 2
MPVEVHAVSREEFDSWMAAKRGIAAAQNELAMQTLSVDELMDQGKRVYDAACLACHGAGGEGGVGKAIAGSPVVLGNIATHMAVVANGVSGTAMQAFGNQLSAVDLAAVLTYQRNAFGNNTGDVIQPGDVAGSKNG